LKSIVLIGAGNVATHLGLSLQKAGFEMAAVCSRTSTHGQQLATLLNSNAVDSLKAVPLNAGLYIIAVADSAIESVSAELPEVEGLVVHTSGIAPLSVLHKHKRSGVLYPLQSINKQVPTNFEKVPILVESTKTRDLEILEFVANELKATPFRITSEQKKMVHLAAVFANNFTNHLYGVAYQLLQSQGISFDLLLPLIAETARKVQTEIPQTVQTGPAMRNDIETIQAHLELLQRYPQYRQLYDLFSQSIRNTNRASTSEN
jgi:predicted short-subunit dehydrogenase-like oxidoreductase (DUF2520 family)